MAQSQVEEPATPKRRGRPPGSRNRKTLDQGPLDLDQGHDITVTVGAGDLARREQEQVQAGAPSKAARSGTATPRPAVPRREQLAKLRDLRQAMEVRTVRRVLGLTTAELAYKLGASRSDIEQWEIGRLPVPRAVRLALRYLLLGILEPL